MENKLKAFIQKTNIKENEFELDYTVRYDEFYEQDVYWVTATPINMWSDDVNYETFTIRVMLEGAETIQDRVKDFKQQIINNI